jgi:hypothetical protein
MAKRGKTTPAKRLRLAPHPKTCTKTVQESVQARRRALLSVSRMISRLGSRTGKPGQQICIKISSNFIRIFHDLGRAAQVLDEALEQPATIGWTEGGFDVIFRMRHHAEHVTVLIHNARDRIGGAVVVPFRRQGAVG